MFHSSTERSIKHRKIEREVDCPPVENPARRKRLEANPRKWLEWYMSTTYADPFSDGHLKLIDNTHKAASGGGNTVTAQPRGEGKSTVLKGCAIELVASGVIKFPTNVGWKHVDAKSAFDFWLQNLATNDRLYADYPRMCAPFRKSTHATAMKNMTWKGTDQKCGAMVDTATKVITLPDSMGAIASRSAQGDAKGLNALLQNGEVIRPDFLLIDDAQDVERADSATAVRKTIDTIENVFMGMSGRQHRLSTAIACTVEHEDDVSSYWLKKRGWSKTLVSRIPVWPDGSKGGTWESQDGCPIRKLWDDWYATYQDEGQESANKFFRRNRKAMVGKMQVSWVHGYDHEKEVSAYDSAMYQWYHLGPDVFSRGQQNNPIKHGIDVYTLSVQTVQGRQVDRAPLVVPQRSEIITVGTDINPSYALTSCCIGFAGDLSADYLYYGRYTDAPLPATPDMSQTQRESVIFGALMRLGEDRLLSMPFAPKGWMIDGGGAQSSVAKKFRYEWMRKHPHLPVYIGYGRAGKSARISARNDTIRARGENWILCRQPDKDYRFDEWVLWHADAWREIQQRAWTCEAGAPGGATLPKGDHREFAEEICREKLIAKGMVGDHMFWDYTRGVGKNDLADAANMAYVMASILGASPGGGAKREKPKAVYLSSRPSERR